MKVAISLPDPVFEAAERLAKGLKKPRSKLYAEAIAEYVGIHDQQWVTEKLNEIYGQKPASIDKALYRAQLGTLNDEAW